MKKILFTGLTILFSTYLALAQLTVKPKDTTTCPTQKIPYVANFEADKPTNITSDDDFGNVVNLGFNFTFYGTPYNQCVVSGNNFISFNLALANQYSSFVYATALASGDLNNAIMFPFHDLNPFGLPASAISYVTIGTPGSRKFIVQYCNIPLYSCNNLLVTNQLILYEGSNIIEIHTQNKPAGCAWENGTGVMGIKSGALEMFVAGRNLPNVNWGVANEGLRFTPTSGSTYKLDTIAFNPFPIIIDPDYNNVTWYKEGTPGAIGTGKTITVTAEENVKKYWAVYDGKGTCFDTLNYLFSDTAYVSFNSYVSTRNMEICAGEFYEFHGEKLFQTGQYKKLLTSKLGCDSTETLNLLLNPLPDITLKNLPSIAICEGNSTILNVANPSTNYSYIWYKDGIRIPEMKSDQLSLKEPGEYYVEIMTNKGCKSKSDIIEITLNPNPVAQIISIDNEDKKCTYDTVTVSARSGENYEYVWGPDNAFRNTNYNLSSEKLKAIFRNPITDVTLLVRNQYGCTDTTSTVVRTEACCDIYVPNAFTPNNDGMNDLFLPVLSPLQKIVSFQIYDRFGKLVYHYKLNSKGWDGKYPNGDYASNDVYMYLLEYTCDDGKNYKEKSDVTLLR